ncbi:expressed unknown protein [Seminavis robusta]|uniref:Uncharacterized protein n=1 Tax=Seminavis robusta TaxID=568900 RepID=A0A9N8E8C7_9STRA|nr:expressed unknown protein [Seminavis robusta]|eukprot:Sro621_g176850.1 n/a (306) ;mRNA; f:45727-46731
MSDLITPPRKATPRVRCRQCGGEHLPIRCPLRSPDDRSSKSWKEQVEEYDLKQSAKPFKCTVRLHQGKESLVCSDTVNESLVCSDTVNEFWDDIHTSHNHSLYRDFAGIKKTESSVLYPPDFSLLEPGEYTLVSRAHGISTKDLCIVIDEAVKEPKKHHPLEKATVRSVQEKLLLQFNHFSLSHEGNDLNLDETSVLTEILETKDWKHILESSEEKVDRDLRRVPGSEQDIREAANHILASQELSRVPQDSNHSIRSSETFVLQLHSWLMNGLLVDTAVGMAGEYRKVAIGAHGSRFSSSTDIQF